MTTTPSARTAAATHAGGGRSASRRLVGALAVTQTIGYGVLAYSFPVLLTPIAAELHTSTAAITAALTISIVVSAGAAIPVGRWLDRHSGRALLTGGSTLGVAAVVAWSQVQQVWQLYGVFVLIGLASAACLYEAAFPVVIAAAGPGRRDRDLLAVTIVAGFASTIFFPTTGILLTQLGWRSTLLALAAVLGAITIPVHALLVPGVRQAAVHRRSHVDGASVREALRDRTFWLLAGAFIGQAAAVSAVGVLLVAYLRQVGHAATIAAAVSGLLGVLSVTGRLITTGAARRFGMTTVTAVVFAVQAAGVIALPHLSRSVAGAAICVVAFGVGFGVATIARPAIVADRYGITRYATIAASMALPIALARAFAPLAAAITPNSFLTGAGVICLASAALLWRTRTSDTKSSHPDYLGATRFRPTSS